MTRLAAALIASLTLAFFTPAAKAQQMPVVCQPHSKIATHLEKQFREVVVVTGLAGEALFELFASESGTWTVVITRPSMNNLACVQGTGTALTFTGIEYPEPEKKGDPA